MKLKNAIIALAAALALAGCSAKVVDNGGGDVLRGRVVKVSDGDTITVLDDAKTQHKIRLDRIDAPSPTATRTA